MLSDALGAMRARVFIAPGNHDPYSARSPYTLSIWPENVHIFTSNTVERVELPELGCAVYGAAFTSSVQDESLLADFRAPDDGLVHLMVLHGELSAAESRYAPITKAQIAGSGMDYLALGHTHQFGGVLREGKTAYAYAGCPEGRGFDELGEKGVLAGTVEQAPGQSPALSAPHRQRGTRGSVPCRFGAGRSHPRMFFYHIQSARQHGIDNAPHGTARVRTHHSSRPSL